MTDQHMRVAAVFSAAHGDFWRARCECGWTSGVVPFPDPDAAYHAGTLHDAVAHPERIDWGKELDKARRRMFLG